MENNYSDIKDKIQKARQYAMDAHSAVGQTFDGKPYIFHLDLASAFSDIFSSTLNYVYSVAVKNRGYDFYPDFVTDVIAAVYLHDAIEDAHKTYNDIKQIFGQNIAELVFAVTNNKGRSRKDRANEEYYNGIKATFGATFIKHCDRLANMAYSNYSGSGMAEAYKKEHPHYVKALESAECYGYKTMLDAMHDISIGKDPYTKVIEKTLEKYNVQQD